MTFTPAKRPCNILVILAAGSSFISSAFTEEIALMVSLFFCEPYARTTTSSKFETSSIKVILSVSVFSVKFTCCFLKPIKENSNTPLSKGNSKANHPSLFVAVPIATPCTFTVTPGIGCFFVS